MQVAYIHGFNSSHRSFSFIQCKLPDHAVIPISYSSHQPIRDSMDEVRRQLPKGQFSLVGHSLGGVLAVLMAAEHADRVSSLATISAPFGGSRAAITLRWLPGHPKVLEDLTPSSPKIELVSQLRLKVPTLCIYSTSGSLFTSPEPNDSVVTVSSQKALPFGRKVEVKANHFEVLLHERTVKLLQGFLFEGESA
jgi:pimeloyl-ACP methyl ester carboxylesterase